jgi:hypothetical protein
MYREKEKMPEKLRWKSEILGRRKKSGHAPGWQEFMSCTLHFEWLRF